MALVHVQCPQCHSIDVVQYGQQANGTEHPRKTGQQVVDRVL